jgi:hypothetical protein
VRVVEITSRSCPGNEPAVGCVNGVERPSRLHIDCMIFAKRDDSMPPNRDPTPCPACRLQGWLCVCAHAPLIAIRTSLLLVVHVQDLGRTSNTVRLLTLAVRDITLVCHGVFPDPADPASHVPAGATPIVLFPGIRPVNNVVA